MAACSIAALSTAAMVVAPAALAISGATVLDSEQSVSGHTWPLRYGTYNEAKETGFGWEKVYGKHGLRTDKAILFPVRNPNGATPAKNGQSEYFTAYADEYSERNGRYYLVDEIKVQTQVQGYMKSKWGVPLNGDVGVMTAFCRGFTYHCPSWVDKALAGGGAYVEATPGAAPAIAEPIGAPAYSASYTPSSATLVASHAQSTADGGGNGDDGSGEYNDGE